MNFVKTYPNVISEELCKEIIEHYRPSQNEGRFNHGHIKEEVLDLSKDQYWNNLINTKIMEVLNRGIEDYFSFDPLHDTSVYYLRHTSFMHHKPHFGMPAHYDAEFEDFSGEECLRTFIGLIYLNNDFEGGELVFPLQETTIKPEPGLMILFPTSYMYPHLTIPFFGKERFVLRLCVMMDKEALKKNNTL